MDWLDYITLAESLAKEKGEAERRSAVSRAYYALYNYAREWYFKDHRRRHIGLGEGESAHYKLWKEMAKHGKNGGKISNTGQMLRDRRNECDYQKNLTSPLITKQPNSSINMAKATIEDIKNLK